MNYFDLLPTELIIKIINAILDDFTIKNCLKCGKEELEKNRNRLLLCHEWYDYVSFYDFRNRNINHNCFSFALYPIDHPPSGRYNFNNWSFIDGAKYEAIQYTMIFYIGINTVEYIFKNEEVRKKWCYDYIEECFNIINK